MVDNMNAELEGVEESLENLNKFIAAEERALEDALEFVLKTIVNYAKDHAPFKDRTSNLRNSIGANIEKMQEFPADTDPAELETLAPELEKPVIEVDGDDYHGIIAAGMSYAIWVETKEGYWVLTGAIDRFRPLIEEYLGQRMKVEEIDIDELAKQAYKEQML